jgi:hypothetical protein
MCKTLLMRFQLMDECCSAGSTAALRSIIARCRAYRDGKAAFVHNPQKDADAKVAAERRKAEAAKRKA